MCQQAIRAIPRRALQDKGQSRSPARRKQNRAYFWARPQTGAHRKILLTLTERNLAKAGKCCAAPGGTKQRTPMNETGAKTKGKEGRAPGKRAPGGKTVLQVGNTKPRGNGNAIDSSTPSSLRILTMPRVRNLSMTCCASTSGAEAPAVKPMRRLPTSHAGSI